MQSIEELVPPEHLLPDYARSRSYTAAGARFLDTAASRGLQPHHRVLDLGCGVGRFAVALAGYLDERGSYVGIDIHKRSIRICQEYIGQKLDNFKFKRVRPVEAAKFRFPFPLLSDPDRLAARAFHALKDDDKGIQRTVYVVAKDGTIVFAQRGAPPVDDIVAAVGRGG